MIPATLDLKQVISRMTRIGKRSMKVKKAIPPNAPPPRGRSEMIQIYVDADHAGNTVTRRSRTGYVQFVNNAVVNWSSKKQGSIESSTFGSEFVALKTAMEAIRGLRYKLRMMGVPIAGSSYVFCDNRSMIENSSRPESLLKKKSNAIAYYAVREACGMNEKLICYVKTDDNVRGHNDEGTAIRGEKRHSSGTIVI
jgi:hypothetical protein